MNTKMSIERMANKLDSLANITPDKGKMSIERIADAMEKITETSHSEGTASIERIADAIEKYEGGGGSSDLTTVRVTVINNANQTIYISIPTECEENALGEGSPATMIPSQSFRDGETTINVPLYKGACMIAGSEFETVELDIEGNIQQLPNGNLLITGDCTITLSVLQ